MHFEYISKVSGDLGGQLISLWPIQHYGKANEKFTYDY